MIDYDVKLHWRMAGEEKWQVMIVKTRASTSLLAAQIALRDLPNAPIELLGLLIERAKP